MQNTKRKTVLLCINNPAYPDKYLSKFKTASLGQLNLTEQEKLDYMEKSIHVNSEGEIIYPVYAYEEESTEINSNSIPSLLPVAEKDIIGLSESLLVD